MNGYPDEKIRSTSIRYINQHAMTPSTWKSTVIGQAHTALSRLAEMDSGESPIVSCWHSESNWYVLSTRRVLGACRGKTINAAILDVVSNRFGNFKGYGQKGIETMNLGLANGRAVQLEYETGPASMAPIYYFRYWTIKYPVLDKLRA